MNTLNPMVRYLGPYQTVCNDWNYFWTYLSEHISEATQLRLRPARADQPGQPDPAQQRRRSRARPSRSTAAARRRWLTGGNEFLHAQAYGAAVDNQGNADCETGQRGYPLKLNHLDP